MIEELRHIKKNGDEIFSSSEPLVSIVTPVLNGAKYLEECIKSVQMQNYKNIEHIFVDGGSTDGTLEILARYQTDYPRTIRVLSEAKKGVGVAVNRGLAAAAGQILGWIDADDIYEPQAVRTVVEYFTKNENASFVYGGCNMIDEKGYVISSFTIKDFELREAVCKWHYIVFCATFYRNSVIEQVGGLNPLGNDLDFYIRIHRHFRMHRIDFTLANWRLHSGGISLAPHAREKMIRSDRVREDFFLCLRNGGTPFSPRCVRYYVSVLSPLAAILRPVVGGWYPFLKKCLGIGDLYK